VALKKRARKYYESDHSSDEEVKVEKKKKTVQKSSLSAAFKSIMNKTIVEDKEEIPVEEQDAVLSKYKKPARL